MTREECELSIVYLEGIKDNYIEGNGYERHPLPEYYAIETAIKALEQKPETVTEFADRCKECGAKYGKLLKQTRWIPVSERLPEDKQSVLVWCPQYKNIYCSYREKEQWWIFGAFVQIVPNEVLAWMPLPEPYKLESEE